MKENWFETLTESLESEGLLHTWDGMMMAPIQYGETRGYYHEEDGEKRGKPYTYIRYISIYRSDSGRYERPVHYRTN